MGFSRVDYDAINDFLREGMPNEYIAPDLRESIHNSVMLIDEGLKKLPPYREIVYRGATMVTELFEKIKIKDLFHNLIFALSTVDKTIAENLLFLASLIKPGSCSK